MTMPTLSFTAQADRFLEQAQEELQMGDLGQASEEGCGAASQMIKAVAHGRCWPHDEHGLLLKAIGKLVEETRAEELVMLFDAVGVLPRAFYEGNIGPFGVSLRLRSVGIFLERLKQYV